jgi:hypothetical protein
MIYRMPRKGENLLYRLMLKRGHDGQISDFFPQRGNAGAG